jgi:hypothetical protein
MKFVYLTIFILFFIVYVKNKFLENAVYNSNAWDNYRLGDVYRFGKNEFADPGNQMSYHKERFPNSIAAEYLEKNVDNIKENKDLLKSIIEKRPFDFVFQPTDLVIHIRTGDIMCGTKWYPKYFIYSRKDDTQWWDLVKDYIRKNGIKRVFILTGSHKRECLKESKEYLEDRYRFLTNLGVEVIYRTSGTPDEDLLFMYHAPHYISTGGGFGNLVYSISPNKEPITTQVLI